MGCTFPTNSPGHQLQDERDFLPSFLRLPGRFPVTDLCCSEDRTLCWERGSKLLVILVQKVNNLPPTGSQLLKCCTRTSSRACKFSAHACILRNL